MAPFRLYSILLLILFLRGAVHAQKVFDFNTNCRAAYQQIIQLKLAGGQQLIDQEKKAHPDNLIPVFLENYIDFFTLFFNEDPTEFTKRKKLIARRLELLSQGPSSSPFYLYSRSMVNFQWASIRLKFGEKWEGGWQFRRSYLDMRSNGQKFPAFSPNHFFNGALKVAVSTIPDGYKWLGNLFGLKGSGKEGLLQLETFLASEDEWSRLFRDEAIFQYLFLKFYVENERQQVFDYISRHKLDIRNNHLFAYLAANLSLNNQQAANAAKIISERNRSPDYLQSPVWDLEMGFARLAHLNEETPVYLERFLQHFKGKYYVKDVLHKMSWYYYLKGDQVKAEAYRRQVLEKGNTAADADQVALKEARSGKWPNRLLLQTRLLNDGGYYQDALRLLHGKREADFETEEEKMEFVYRVARLYDDTERDQEAIAFYKMVVARWSERKEYYAARSAIQLGYIYERQGDNKTAAAWFNRCLSMKDHDFKNSLDQKAKAGLERCRESSE